MWKYKMDPKSNDVSMRFDFDFVFDFQNSRRGNITLIFASNPGIEYP